MNRPHIALEPASNQTLNSPSGMHHFILFYSMPHWEK